MTMARWQRTIVDGNGTVLPNAQITVRRAVAGLPPAVIKADRDGLVPKVNPFNADSNGFAFFHAAGGAYQITAVSGAFSITWEYVAIGTGAETDAESIVVPTPMIFAFDDATADADPGSGEFRLNNAAPASATQLFISDFNAGAVDVLARIATWDDFGDSANRGVLEIFDPSDPGGTFHAYSVSGANVDGGAYSKVNLTWIAGQGTFVAAQELLFQFTPRGTTGPLAAVEEDPNPTLGGNLDTNGFDVLLEGLEVPLSTGRHSIWVPASAMVSRTTNGAASVTTESTVNDVMKATKDFDQTTSEGVQFDIAMPSSWDKNSTFTFRPYWWAAAGTAGQTVNWTMACRALDDSEAIDQAFGTAQTSIDTLEATGRVHIGPESAAITPASIEEDNCLMTFQVTRDIADNLAADAKLIGVMIFLRIGAPNDSFGFQS